MECYLGNLGPFRNLAFPKGKARGLTVSDTLGELGEEIHSLIPLLITKKVKF